MTAKDLIQKCGMGDCKVEDVLNRKGGKVRSAVPKSVWRNTLSELVALAKTDQEARTALKVLSNLDHYKERY